MEGMFNLTESQVRNSIKTLDQGTGTTISTTDRGTSITQYTLQPTMFLKAIIDGAKSQHYFLPFCNEITLPTGTYQITIPRRTKYLGRDVGTTGFQIGTSEPTNADMTVTQIDNMDGSVITPTPKYSGVALSNYNLRVNALNLVQYAKDELTYGIGDHIDQYIVSTIGDATDASSGTTWGCQTLYGGDATSDNSLSAGDVITTDLVAKAARYLKQKNCYYWVTADGGATGTETACADKNPWMPTAQEPFVLFVGPAQEETFRKDSQFVNAAEYGSDKVIHNGEIGDYLGIRIIVTNNVENVGTVYAAPDRAQTAGTANPGVEMTRCILMKSKKAFTFVWGEKPKLKVFDYPQRDQTWVTLITSYAGGVVHSDAIVFVDVANA